MRNTSVVSHLFLMKGCIVTKTALSLTLADVKLAEDQGPFMVQLISHIANDEERSDTNVANSVGLLG